MTLRCFNIAGAVAGIGDDDPTRLVPNVLRAAAGELPQLSVNGDGSAVREYVHVADVATACRLALGATELGTHRTYNIGTGHGATVMEVVGAVERITGLPVPVEFRLATNEPHTILADSGRAQRELGWKPTRSSLDQIIADAWAAKTAAGPMVSPR